MDFYDKFEKICKIENTTCYEVCKEVGLTQAALSMWRNRKNTPTKKTISKIAYYFRIPMDYFIDDNITDPTPYLEETRELLEEAICLGCLTPDCEVKDIDVDKPLALLTETNDPIVSVPEGGFVDYFQYINKKMKDLDEEELQEIMEFVDHICYEHKVKQKNGDNK